MVLKREVKVASKKKKKVVKRTVKKHKRRVVVKSRGIGGNSIKSQPVQQNVNESYDSNKDDKNNYGSGEFGNTNNVLDRGEVIYGDENEAAQNTVSENVQNNLGSENIVEGENQEIRENNEIDSNEFENQSSYEEKPQDEITAKPEMILPPIPKINSKNKEPKMQQAKKINNKSKSTEPVLSNKKIIKSAEPEYSRKNIMGEKEIAMDFAIKVHKKFDRLIKASVLFGSQTSAKDNAMAGSDIDIIFIIDDAAVDWDLELVSWYREELGKLVSTQDYGVELHINTVRLVTWWEDLIHGDPVVINILRYGEALIDSGGFFNPIKALLLAGKIRSTPEAVYAALQRSPWHLTRSRNASLGAIEGVYWSMIDAAHAALITAGKLPPSPEHVPEMLREVFVDSGMLKMNFVKSVKEVYSLHKAISHGNVSSIKGQEIDEWQEIAEKFLSEMTRIIDLILESKK